MRAATGKALRNPGKRQRMEVTPEGIALPVTVAARSARFAALAIDFMIFIVAWIVIQLGFSAMGAGASADGGELSEQAMTAARFLAIVKALVLFLLGNGYFLVFELGPRGATPGKRLLGIRVAARQGGWLTAEMVIARNLIRDIELFLPMVMFMVAGLSRDNWTTGWLAFGWFMIFALLPFFNRDGLRAGDMIAGTWVVEAPRVQLAPAMSLTEAATAGTSKATGTTYRFGERELAVYGEYELQTLEKVLREGRQEAMATVQEAICRKIGWDPGKGDERAFLEAYYTQLRARLEAQMRLGVRKSDKWAGGS